MADHLATNAEFGAQKIAAIKGQFPWHVDELIVQTEKEVSGGKTGEALLHGSRQEMGKDQCSQSLDIAVGALDRCQLPYHPRGAERRPLIGQCGDPGQLLANLRQQTILDLEAAAWHHRGDLCEVHSNSMLLP
jgi:hypothetical protein